MTRSSSFLGAGPLKTDESYFSEEVRLLAVLVTALALGGANWHTFRAHGVSVRYPPSWYATARPLTPVVAPSQILAVASYRLPHGSGGAKGCLPKEALDRMPAKGAFIFGWEYGPGMPTRNFPSRPKHFRLMNYGLYECFGPSYALWFRQAGRFFQIHVFLGKRAGKAQRAAVLRVLDTFSAKPM